MQSHSSVEERSVHTGKVAGSNPVGTTAAAGGYTSGGFFVPVFGIVRWRSGPGQSPTPVCGVAWITPEVIEVNGLLGVYSGVFVGLSTIIAGTN